MIGVQLIPLDPRQLVSIDEPFVSQRVAQQTFSRVLAEKGIFTNDEFLGMVRVVDRERRRRK